MAFTGGPGLQWKILDFIVGWNSAHPSAPQ